MYKSVMIIAVGALGLAAIVGVNPPDVQDVEAVTGAKLDAKPAKAAAKIEESDPPATVETMAGNGLASATLSRESDGHFYAEAQVSGIPLRLLVDTGASTVALTRADAQAIGLQFSDEEFTGTGQGAGGTVRVKPVIIDRLAIGPIEADNVRAVIADDSLKQSLLGQSFLSRVGSVAIKGSTMELR